MKQTLFSPLKIGLPIVALGLALSAPAHAHLCMDTPMSRVGPSCDSDSPMAPGPCGVSGRSTKYVTEFKPGQTIDVEINELLQHPSHFRIAFNPNGDSFEDPVNQKDNEGKHPFVLLDNIENKPGALQTERVTLPNVTCDKCTLQLIQVVYQGETGVGMYYACADIVLKGTPSTNPDAGTGGDAGSTGQDAGARDAGGDGGRDAGGGGRDAGGSRQDAGTSEPDDAGVAAPEDAGSTSADASHDHGGSGATDASRDDEETETDAGETDSDDVEGGCSALPGAAGSGALSAWLSLGACLALRRRPRR